MTSEEAEFLVQHIEESLFKGPGAPGKPLFPSQHVEERIVRLDSGTTHYYPVEGLSEKNENSALLHYIQLEQDDSKINVQLELFVLSAKQAAFNQLRSTEQLGYIVQLGTRNDSGIRGAEFIIQSTVKDPAQLDLRVEAFLKMFESKLHAMSDDEFKTNVDALIDNKLEKHKNLQEQSSFYWSEIELGTLKFDRKEIEVAELRKLTKQDLIYFFDNYIKHGCPGRRKLTVQVYGSSHSGAYKQTKSIDISSDKNVCNGKTVTADTSDRELLKDDAVKLASSDQSSDMNSCELDGYRAKRIDDIHSFKRSQTLFGSLSGVNQIYT
jgi:insulysin